MGIAKSKNTVKKFKTKKQLEKERYNATIFAFVILCVASSGYLIEAEFTYHPNNSLVPNFMNVISQYLFHVDFIPDESSMFMLDYYVQMNKNESVNDYVYRTRFIPEKRLENKIWGGWLFMILGFTPLFIIELLDLKVQKIKIKKFIHHHKTSDNN